MNDGCAWHDGCSRAAVLGSMSGFGIATESIAAKTATGKIVLFVLASWTELLSERSDRQ